MNNGIEGVDRGRGLTSPPNLMDTDDMTAKD